jgi:hypothetical protein
MPDEKLTPADPKDLADAIAFALSFSGRKRVHDADVFMGRIASLFSTKDAFSTKV